MAGKTDFGRISADIEKNKAKVSYGDKPKPNWLSIPFGDTTFLVLPPKDDESNLYEEVFIHFKLLDHNGDSRAYKCSRPEHGRCPICDKVEKMKKAGKTKEAAEIQGKRLYLYNVRDIDGKNRLAQFKKTQHDMILLEMQNSYADDGIDITDMKEGIQIKLSRLKVNPWANARTMRKPLSLSPDEIEALDKGMFCLKTAFVDLTPEELEDVLAGRQLERFVKKEKPEETNTEEEVEETTVEEKIEEPVKEEPNKRKRRTRAEMEEEVRKEEALSAKTKEKIEEPVKEEKVEDTSSEVDDIMAMLED